MTNGFSWPAKIMASPFNNVLLVDLINIVLLFESVDIAYYLNQFDILLVCSISGFGGHFVFIQIRESKLIHALKNYVWNQHTKFESKKIKFD